MPVAPRATTRLTILLLRYRPKTLAIRTYPALKNLSPRIQSQPRHITMWRSQLKKRIGRIRRRGSKTRGRSILVSKPRPLALTPRLQRKRYRPDALIVIKKATMQMSTPNLQKLVLVSATSVPVTNNRGEEVVFEIIPCIYYPVWLQEDQK